MRKNKIFKRVLAFASTFIVLVSLCATIAFAQAPQTNIDVYGSSPNVIVTAYKYQPSEIYPYSAPLWQFQAYGFTYSEMFPNGQATGGCVSVFYENYFNEYNIDEIYNIEYNFIYQITSYTGQYSGTLIYDYFNGTLQYAIDNSKFPLADTSLFTDSLENAYYNQFTYWENSVNESYNTGYTDGITTGYTNALNDFDMFERGLFDIFNAPFIFVRNIVGFEIFGITISDVIIGVLLLCLGFVLIKFIGGAIPL